MQMIRSLALIQWHCQSGRRLSGEAITGEIFTQSRKVAKKMGTLRGRRARRVCVRYKICSQFSNTRFDL